MLLLALQGVLLRACCVKRPTMGYPKDCHHFWGVTLATRRRLLNDKKINAAYEANQLTLQEADDLRDKMKKIKTKEEKMKDKNGGKLSYENLTSIEKDLNGVSDKLHKKMLDKRAE